MTRPNRYYRRAAGGETSIPLREAPANELVWINFVLQAPGHGYTVDGATIRLHGEPLLKGDSIDVTYTV